ncbi:rust resistance kinase Lr10-like isoform X2 [Prosopis cineraria]|nr:rust resistance kinase Lr10-like isoform X2 [Prosopis cineraria]XP_054820954.1 rust resistance kinase Lr10-like isoform X2 [Prosopis cineraria]
MNRGNAHKQCVPFRLEQAKLDSSNPCFLHTETNNVEMVEFPDVPALEGVRLVVLSKNYKSRFLELCDVGGCLPELYLRLYNSSIHPFFPFEPFISLSSNEISSLTFFDCSSIGSNHLKNDDYPHQDMHTCPIYVVDSTRGILKEDVIFCTKMRQLDSRLDQYSIQLNRFKFRWSQPKCDVEHKHSKIFQFVLPASGSIVFVMCIVFLIYRYFKTKQDDHARLEKFLKDYEALKPTRFSYADLKRITNRFKDKIGEGAHGSVFKGKLSNQIIVAVKVLNNSDDDRKDFINEMGTMGKIHHINVVRLLGFCAEGFHRALVYDFFSNGSLQKSISSPDNKENFLGWLKLQQIAVGIAKGIEYLHHDCDYRILHFDINPGNVLLDHNFTPKISDFGLAKLCSKNQSVVSITTARGTLGYIAPEVFSKNFGNVSYKSDIYSYGMLLLEMVGGRKNIHTSQEACEILYPKWIHNLIEGGDINIHMEDVNDHIIARKLAIVGLWCIQWQPISRPSMKTVIQMLEREGDELKVPPIHFDSTNSINANMNIPARHLSLELEVIHELE